MSDEFANLNIDDECCCEENEDVVVFNNDDFFQNQVLKKDDQPESILFHFSLIKMLVVEEIEKLNRDQVSFLISENISLDPKRYTPLSVEKSTFHSSGVKGGGVTERGKGK